MSEMFLKLDGVPGESLDKEHKDEIEILGWNWTTKNDVRWELNQGGQSTRVEIQQISIRKICDKASVTLYKNCVTGRHIPNAKITCRKNAGDHKFIYLTVELTDIMVSNVTWEGEGERQALNEILELRFAEFKLNYKTQQDLGGAAGAVSFGFHIQKQQAVA